MVFWGCSQPVQSNEAAIVAVIRPIMQICFIFLFFQSCFSDNGQLDSADKGT